MLSEKKRSHFQHLTFMSCPVDNGSGLFRQLPLLTFEILFVYLLVSRYSIRFILFSSAFFTFCIAYCFYYKFRYQQLFNFNHSPSAPNVKAIPIPSTTNNDDIIIYHYRTSKQSILHRLRCRYEFAMPSNMEPLSIPDHELNASEFIKLWKDQHCEHSKFTLKPYCIDPFDLSVWILRINVHPQDVDSQLRALQYDWNRTCDFYRSTDSNTECSLYRISREHFIRICQSMEKEHHLLRSMKFVSSRLCLVFDSDFESHCSTGDHIGYLLHFTTTSSSETDGIHFISNHAAFTAVQFRYVQLKRSQSLNAVELKRFQSKMSMLFYHYFLFLYGAECVHRGGDKMILRMCTSDIFWTDFLVMALPAVRKLFVYQSIYKSMERAYNIHHRNDSMCYFLSWFCLDDIYIRSVPLYLDIYGVDVELCAMISL